MVTRSLPIWTFAAIVLAAGVVHGLNTERWAPSTNVQEAVARLEAVPNVVGEWQGSEQAVEDEALRRAGISGWLSRRYRHTRTGDAVGILLVCGRPGPISVHTPDVCYAGSGYEAVGAQYHKEVSLSPIHSCSVWAMQFRTPGPAEQSRIEVHWVWNAGAGWTAPTKPRWSFAGSGGLYKLYVVRDVPVAKSAQKRDAGKEFLQIFLPELENALFATQSP